MDNRISVVIVSHDSEKVLPLCFDSLSRQTIPPNTIYLVDSGSKDRNYLDAYRILEDVVVFDVENIGFSKANNIGFAECAENSDFVLFLNPDAFLSPSYIERASFNMMSNPSVGAAGGKIFKYDMEKKGHTNIIDSTGIVRKWYGRWQDRGQGVEDRGQFDVSGEVSAICGAVMFCRCSALIENGVISAFDPDFFLYKEDIELCLRLRKKGWTLKYFPDLIAYHGRGWNTDRNSIPFVLRRTAAESELLLYKKHPSPYMLWAILKYILVRILRV